MSGIDGGIMRRSRAYRVIYLFAYNLLHCCTATPMIVSETGREDIHMTLAILVDPEQHKRKLSSPAT